MPEIEMLDGWNCDISSCKNWNDLPENAKKYIERIEELIGHSIYLVSTGAKRDAYLLKE
jgi:adenylosuccinate synthase